MAKYGVYHFGRVKRASAQAYVDTAAYAAGDNVGGVLTFSNVVEQDGGSGVVRLVQLLDKDGTLVSETGPFTLVLYDGSHDFASDTTTTVIEDNETLLVPASDAAHIVGHVIVASSDFSADLGTATVSYNECEIPFCLGDGRNLGGFIYTGAVIETSDTATGFSDSVALTVTLTVTDG